MKIARNAIETVDLCSVKFAPRTPAELPPWEAEVERIFRDELQPGDGLLVAPEDAGCDLSRLKERLRELVHARPVFKKHRVIRRSTECGCVLLLKPKVIPPAVRR